MLTPASALDVLLLVSKGGKQPITARVKKDTNKKNMRVTTNLPKYSQTVITVARSIGLNKDKTYAVLT